MICVVRTFDHRAVLRRPQVNRLKQTPALMDAIGSADDGWGNHDGNIDLKEWLTHIHSLCYKDGGKLAATMLLAEMEEELVWKPTLELAETLWKLLDRDQSSSVDTREFNALKTYGYLKGIATSLEDLDTDQSGVVEKGDFITKVKSAHEKSAPMARIIIEGAIAEMKKKAYKLAMEDKELAAASKTAPKT